MPRRLYSLLLASGRAKLPDDREGQPCRVRSRYMDMGGCDAYGTMSMDQIK